MKRICVLLLAAIMCLSSFCVTAYDIDAGSTTVKDIGIPLASAFPDSSGRAFARSIWGMQEYRGRIYVGCGEYNMNCGSMIGGMPVFCYDPTRGTWIQEATLSDEQLTRFYVENENLHIASTDPMSGTTGAIYTHNGKGWSTRQNIPGGVHVFDLEYSEDGRTIWASLGTNEGLAPAVALSKDSGVNFKQIKFRYDGNVIEGNYFTDNGVYASTVYGRSHNVFEYDGQIYATLYVYGGSWDYHNKFSGLYKYNESAGYFDYYCSAPYALCTSIQYITQGTYLEYDGTFVLAYGAFYVFSDDLKSVSYLRGARGNITCAKVIGNAVYFTSYEETSSGYISRLYKTTDLSGCELLAEFTFPAYVRSFEYYRGKFYMGTQGTSYSSCEKECGTVFEVVPHKSGCTHPNKLSAHTAPTDTMSGRTVTYCVDCGLEETKELPPLHKIDLKWTVDTAPTCTVPGVKSHHCADCDKRFDVTEIPATGHDFGEGEVQQTRSCVDAEIILYTCSRCHLKNEQTQPPLGHDYMSDFTVDKEPTEYEEGEMSRHCSRCSARTDRMKIPMLEPADDTDCKNDPAHCPSSKYTDTPSYGNWAHAGIDFCIKNGLMNGVSGTLFRPGDTMTRAMLVTVLYRLNGSPDCDCAVSFTDLRQSWYKDAVSWAYKNGIVKGTSSTTFSPDTAVTREQLAAILYRCCEYMGDDVSARCLLSDFPDEDRVSSYAHDALSWAGALGLIAGVRDGDKNYLRPSDGATRAQVATILCRFVKRNTNAS